MEMNEHKDPTVQQAHGRPDRKTRRSDVITPKQGTDMTRLL